MVWLEHVLDNMINNTDRISRMIFFENSGIFRYFPESDKANRIKQVQDRHPDLPFGMNYAPLSVENLFKLLTCGAYPVPGRFPADFAGVQ